MFGKKQNNNPANTGADGLALPNSEQILTSVIAPTTRIEGIIRTSQNMRLDGQLVGSLYCEKKVVLGKTGNIEGNLNSLEAAIEGNIDGVVDIKEILHLSSSGSMKGNVQALKMSIENGAKYSGELHIG